MRQSLVDSFFYDEEEDEDTLKDKYLTFHLNGEDYALEIRYVTEIVSIQKITDVPDLPAFVKGVINLRGQVIPVLDLRLRFGMEARAYDERTCVIITRLHESPVGLVVDSVNEVHDIPPQDVTPPPSVAKGGASRFVQGFGHIGDKIEILLNAQKLLGEEELDALETIVS